MEPDTCTVVFLAVAFNCTLSYSVLDIQNFLNVCRSAAIYLCGLGKESQVFPDSGGPPVRSHTILTPLLWELPERKDENNAAVLNIPGLKQVPPISILSHTVSRPLIYKRVTCTLFVNELNWNEMAIKITTPLDPRVDL